jgi:hypothetical protein
VSCALPLQHPVTRQAATGRVAKAYADLAADFVAITALTRVVVSIPGEGPVQARQSCFPQSWAAGRPGSTESSKQEKRKENKVREPNLELWRRRREELLHQAEMNRLGRELHAARRRASSRPRARDGGLAGCIGAKIIWKRYSARS